MKKGIYLALSMVVAFGALASCGGKGDDCEHTYAAEWSSDVRGHWKAFTCDCEGLYPQVIAHVDSNNDGECDDCGYTGGHEHTYAAEWTAGENGHYHAATCGHDVKSEEVAHEENDIGKCVDCGATVSVLPITTVAEALEIANAQKKAVTHGTVEMANNGYYSSKDNAYYEFFEDYTYVSVKGDNGEKEGYYSLDKNGNIFAVENGELPSEEASEDMMNGYGFNLSYVWGDFSIVYGVDALVEALYEKASEDYASYQENLEDAKLTEDEELIADVQYVIDNCGYSESVKDGVASFAFVYADGDGYAWKISVEFTLSEDYYIEEATVYSEKYTDFTSETKVVVKGTEANEFSEQTATIYTFAEGAEASGTNEISIAQNPVIEEDNSNPYAPEKMLVTEFDLTNRADEEKVEDGAKLTVEVGTKIFLDVTVDNEKAKFSSMIFAIDDEVLTHAYEDTRIALSHNKGFNMDTYQYENAVMMNTKQEGTYKVTLTYGEAIKNITVEVTPVATKSLKATAYVDYEWVEDVNIYTGMEIDVQVEANEYADASHTYAIVSDNADDMTFTANDDGTYTFTSKVAGTYEIKFTSTV
ncbi:MAG: hypothetical protein IJY05_01035, partial [Clostridia bacterium]|nr:hypothetical protein [Clostridia bacterium]